MFSSNALFGFQNYPVLSLKSVGFLIKSGFLVKRMAIIANILYVYYMLEIETVVSLFTRITSFSSHNNSMIWALLSHFID